MMMFMNKHPVLHANRHTGQTTLLDVQRRMQVKREEWC
jgi:hypothetical protein